jgi:superfamily II DNA or RNA helicase
MPAEPKYRKGDSIVLRSIREQGLVLQDPSREAGEYWYRVRFVNRTEHVVEADLDPLDEADESLEDLARAGRWGRLRAFRCALAVERITNQNRSTIYSFRAQRILFEPYQYKPLLKILDSPDRRLLIADEVGLGKTIEAGLILTELEARLPLDRVLVVCPSRLKEKWRDELNRKFDQEFDLFDRRGFLAYVDRCRQNARQPRLRAIMSMQSLRDDELRELLEAEIGQMDLVIVDEAHHARNPATRTSPLLRDLCAVGRSVLLLTATPLHLGSRDLYTLLSALRPPEFPDPTVFDQRLKRYAGVHEASRLVRTRTTEGLAVVREQLERIFLQEVPPDYRDPLALQVLREIQESPPSTPHDWVDLERRIQDLHPLATIVTRTRKRDVQEHAATRRARVYRCTWTPREQEVYEQLVGGCSDFGWPPEALSFGQIQRARQAASCLPAAAHGQGLVPATSDDEALELTDILPSDSPATAAQRTPELAPPSLAGAWSDSKYETLRELLRHVWEEEPDAKVLIFTFFAGTSNYLVDRLSQEGVSALRIAGDVPSNAHNPVQDERGKRMRRFREDPQVRVLVSTEVGSEGLDFQFCHHLVNYDLPWNPMVVEQRIGRIDRFGQGSEVVHIHNLVVEGTVEDRILARLYERIGLFKAAIGDLETILGETVGELARDYLSARLRPEEAEARVEQAVQAIDRRRRDLERLEQSAVELFGHEDYIRAEMERVRRLGRFITEESILGVLGAYFESYHPEVKLWDEGEGIHGLRLTDSLRRNIQEAARGGPPWIDRSENSRLLITMAGELAFQRPELELVNIAHPLLRAAVKAVQEQLQSPISRVAQSRLCLPPGEDEEFAPGNYFLLVFTHTVEGIRGRRILETIGWSADQGTPLEAELGERLLHLVLAHGSEWDSQAAAPPAPEQAWAAMTGEARARNRNLRERETQENEALYTRRRADLQAEYEHDRGVKEGKLRTAEARGRDRVVP